MPQLRGVSKMPMSSLNLRDLKLSKLYKISMYGQDILSEISKVPFEISHKISYPYIERCMGTWYTQHTGL